MLQLTPSGSIFDGVVSTSGTWHYTANDDVEIHSASIDETLRRRWKQPRRVSDRHSFDLHFLPLQYSQVSKHQLVSIHTCGSSDTDADTRIFISAQATMLYIGAAPWRLGQNCMYKATTSIIIEPPQREGCQRQHIRRAAFGLANTAGDIIG